MRVVEGFLLALFEPAEYELIYGHDPAEHGDVDWSGSVDSGDIEPFLNLLFGP